MCSGYLTPFGTFKYGCVKKAREMFSFPPLINNSVTIWLTFLLLSISATISSKRLIIYVFYLGCSSQFFCKFCKYDPYNLTIQ